MTNKASGIAGDPYYSKFVLLPVISYPFMFLIRVIDPESVLLSIFPDLLTLFVVFIFGVYCVPNIKRKFILFILVLHLMLTYILTLLHVGDLHFLLITFRQYTLPILYFIIFIAASEKYQGLPVSAVKCSIISFGLVCLISTLNFFDFIRINPSMEALYPYLNYAVEATNQNVGRMIFDNFSFNRINLFVGGAVGSSAAILFCLGIVAITQVQSIPGWIFRFFGLVLVLSSVLTLSVSLFIPLLLFLAISYINGKGRLLIVAACGVLILVGMLGPNIFLDKSPLEYFRATIYSELVGYLVNIDWLAFVLGVGPRFVSSGYEFMPDSFLIDVGLLRVFVESGFLNMILFFTFLMYVGYICFSRFSWFSVNGAIFFPLIFFTYTLMVHANMTILPPFFPLFAAVVAGILLVRADDQASFINRKFS